MKLTVKQAIRRGLIKVAGPKPQWKIDEERQKQKAIAKRRQQTKRQAKARRKK